MFLKIQNSKVFTTNFLLSIMPLSYIAGNLILNLNVGLFLIFFFFLWKPNFFDFKFSYLDKLIFIFFLYIFLNGFVNNYFNFTPEKNDEKNLIFLKAIGYLRFVILYLAIRYLVNFNIIKFKYLFLTFGLSALFVSLDIIYQFFFRIDFFGFEAPSTDRRLAGPFGDEWIAGSFIQRFYIFIIFYILIFIKQKKEWQLNLFFLIILLLVSLGVLMSGNRIPTVIYFLSIFLIIIFEKSLRKKLMVLIIIFLSSLYFLGQKNEVIKVHYSSFITKSIDIFNYYKNKYDFSSENELKIPNSYIKEFETGILTWKENKIFGSGIKSFYYSCKKIEFKIKNLGLCSPHPHNYYIQFAAELGLVGLLLSILIFFFIIFEAFKIFFFKEKFSDIKLLLPFFIIFIVEIFPFKTTGSFFTTTNSTFIFILISFIVGLIYRKKIISNE